MIHKPQYNHTSSAESNQIVSVCSNIYENMSVHRVHVWRVSLSFFFRNVFVLSVNVNNSKKKQVFYMYKMK